ncbi:N-acetylglucosamine-6-phosphate deacetylase [Eubacteriales bacterium OttesenSCG-928-M02]|nr:N-acetylglucosamine-6-phosphate deacetylase [Eubacteriales bacterium OttesenSCG-928-M02]
MKTLLLSSHIYTENEKVSGGVLLADGVIKGIIPMEEVGEVSFDATVVDYGQNRILPGLIDPHMHGYMGWTASKTTDPTDVLKLADVMAINGVTAFQPSCVSTHYMEDNVTAIADAISMQETGAKILGCYMEGPYYNPQYDGGTPVEFFRKPTLAEAQGFYEAGKGKLTSIGLAPELAGADEVIDFFVQNGVRVGIAHTRATYREGMDAINRGCSMATHTFNAMRPLHHREVGVAGAVLRNKEIYNEINCDLNHVCKEMMELLFELKPWNRILMMTDTDPIAGLAAGRYLIDDREMICEPTGQIHLVDGTIYGSAHPLLYGLKNLVTVLDIPLEKAVRAASLNQAEFLGIAAKKGSIAPGKDGDIIVIDEDFSCIATYIAGEKVYDGAKQSRESFINPIYAEKRIG